MAFAIGDIVRVEKGFRGVNDKDVGRVAEIVAIYNNSEGSQVGIEYSIKFLDAEGGRYAGWTEDKLTRIRRGESKIYLASIRKATAELRKALLADEKLYNGLVASIASALREIPIGTGLNGVARIVADRIVGKSQGADDYEPGAAQEDLQGKSKG